MSFKSTILSKSDRGCERSPECEGGFTLLEVIIVMAILVFISFGIYQATTESFKLRDVLSIEGEFYNEIRFSMSVMQRDISLIYSPMLLLPTPAASASPTAQTPASAQQAQQQAQEKAKSFAGTELILESQYWLVANDVSGLRPSHFIGTENKISFISVSHRRIYKDSPESEFAKISYEIKKDETSIYLDPKDIDRLRDTMILVKTENADAFEMDDTKAKDDPMQHQYTLMHGIKTFKFRYYRKDNTQWYPNWDNDKDDLYGLFPDIIELTVQVAGPKNLSYDGVYQMRPEVPLSALDPSS